MTPSLRLIVALFLLPAVGLAAPTSQCLVNALLRHQPQPQTQHLSQIMAADFTDAYSKDFLSHLRPLDISQQELADVGTLFSQFHFDHDVNRTIKMVAYPYRDITQAGAHRVWVGKFYEAQNPFIPLGFWAKTFKQDLYGEPMVHYDFIKTRTDAPTIRGISDSLDTLFSKLNAQLHVKYEDLQADWVGRYVWAKHEYQFSPNESFLENGQKVSQLELARKNFLRFLTSYRLEISQIGKITPEGTVLKLHSLDDLKTPDDFASVVALDGTRVTINPYIDDGVIAPPEAMNIGKAFFLGDSRARPGQATEIKSTFEDDTYSDIYMPAWYGIRHY